MSSNATTTGAPSIAAPVSSVKTKKPRKKTARACVHCHKSHMTCDSDRPCKRCVNRGLADTCVDAPRKKKKYLMDISEDQIALQEAAEKQNEENNRSLPQTANVPYGGNTSQFNGALGNNNAANNENLDSMLNFGNNLAPAGPHSQSVPDRYYNLGFNNSFPNNPSRNNGDFNNKLNNSSGSSSLFGPGLAKNNNSSNTGQLLSMNTSQFLSQQNVNPKQEQLTDNSFSAITSPALGAKDMNEQVSSLTTQSLSPAGATSQFNGNHSSNQNQNQNYNNPQLPPTRKRRPSRFSSVAADLEYAVLTNIIRENPEPLINNDGSIDFLNSASMSESNSVQNGSQQNYNPLIPNFPFFNNTNVNHSNNDNNNNNSHGPNNLESPAASHNAHGHTTASSVYSDTPTPPQIGSPPSHQPYSLFSNREHMHNNHHNKHPYNHGLHGVNTHHQQPQQQQPRHPQQNQHRQLHQQISRSNSRTMSESNYNLYPQRDSTINQYFLGPLPGLPDSKPYLTYPDIVDIIKANAIEEAAHQDKKRKRSTLSFAIGVHSDDNTHNFHHSHELSGQWGLQFKEPEEIYSQVRKPFSYTTGFHLLVVYLRRRFDDDKTVLVKLAKSMAEYRPSFTAQVMSLKEEDLIFMEQCFQRTLLEYNKYLSISGTPTIIWRRTGQISFVSQEFVMLTGWTSDALLSKITFIVELMNDSSVIRYFELFSKIAYGDTTGAGTSEFTLVNPTRDKEIRTKSIWTLKRDVFGIPMMIIGNFLPFLD